ncbi:hypothetical protein BH11PLA1_BH11PLA1_03720 [soil metagenome]
MRATDNRNHSFLSAGKRVARTGTSRSSLALFSALFTFLTLTQPTRATPAPTPPPDSPSFFPTLPPKTSSPDPRNPIKRTTVGESLPSAAIALSSFADLRRWLDAGAVDEHALCDALAGVCVEVRFGAEVVGRGTAFASLDGAGAQETLKRAARTAFAQTRKNLDISAGNSGQPAQRLATLGPNLLLSLELAGPLTPISPATGAELDAMISPGMEGFALAKADRVEGIFPARLLLGAERPGAALQTLVAAFTNDAAQALVEPPDLAKRGVTLLRLRALHLAQSGPNTLPNFIHRGQRVVDIAEVDTRAKLAEFAGRMQSFLLARVNDRAAKTPLPTYALATYALAHARTPDTDLSGARDFLRAQLAAQPQDDLADPTLAAMSWLALHPYTPHSLVFVGHPLPPPDDMLAALEKSVSAADAAPATAKLSPSRAALLNFAVVNLVGARSIEGSIASTQRAAALARTSTLIAATPAADLVSTMPWLALTARDIEPDFPAPLREMRSLIWDHQITPADAGPDEADLIGGIVFTRGRTPLPTWQSARALAGIAVLLADERATPAAERSAHLVKLLAGIRFLRQLECDDSAAWALDPTLNRGGIRPAPWELRPTIEATAMSLIAVDELIKALDALTPKK